MGGGTPHKQVAIVTVYGGVHPLPIPLSKFHLAFSPTIPPPSSAFHSCFHNSNHLHQLHKLLPNTSSHLPHHPTTFPIYPTTFPTHPTPVLTHLVILPTNPSIFPTDSTTFHRPDGLFLPPCIVLLSSYTSIRFLILLWVGGNPPYIHVMGIHVMGVPPP